VRAAPGHVWLATATLVLLARPAGPASAQVAVSATVDSDYRQRGVSFSNGRPAASLTLAYDHASSLYLGGSAIAEATDRAGPEMLGDIVYAGYAGRLNAVTSWDAGVSNERVAIWVDRPYRFDYTEIYAGLTRGDVSAHVYFSPGYLGGGPPTLYAELNGAVRPAAHWRVFGHAGVLTPLEGRGGEYASRSRLDARAGVARELGKFEIRLAWTTITPALEFPPGYLQARNALVLSAGYAF
jgi:uncharacterized protein (TIGR02001 family)